jgi:hypothetical protein
MVTQLLRPARGSAELGYFIAQLAYAALLELRGRRSERLRFVHDLTLMTGYDVEARQILTVWGLEIRDHIERITVVQPQDALDSIRFGLEGSAAALTSRGLRFEIVQRLEDAIGRYGLVPQTRARRPPQSRRR